MWIVYCGVARKSHAANRNGVIMKPKGDRVLTPGVRRRDFATTLSVIAIGCVVLGGCAKATVPTEPESFADVVAAAIQEAEAGGASDAQLAILRQAQSEGELSLEDARTAAHAVVDCINDAGSFAFYGEHTASSGLVTPEYSWSVDTSEQEAIGNACDQQEAFWVNMIYQAQPSSVELTEGYRAQQAPILRSCLERNGYTVDPDASTNDLIAQALLVDSETSSAVDCITEAGIE